MLFHNDSIQTLLARVHGIMGPFPAHMLEQGRDVPKYFTPLHTIYERKTAEAQDGDAGGPGGSEAGGGEGNGEGNGGGGGGGEESAEGGDTFTLLFPKRTSLRFRLRVDCPEFIDFMEGAC